MLPLALVADARIATGSYATAGAALAVFAVTSSILAPLRGRAIDRHGPVALVILALFYTLALTGVWAGGASRLVSVSIVVVLAGVAGGCAPPVAAFARSVIGRLFETDKRLDAAFALDSALGELALVTGPAIVGGLLAVTAPGVALFTTGLVAFLGSAGMGALAVRPAPGIATGRSALGVRQLLAPFSLLLGLGTALGVLDVAIPALSQAHGSLGRAGLLLAALAVGSVLGGLAYGARNWSISIATRSLAASAVFAILLGANSLVAAWPAAVAATLLLAGFALQPAMIALYLEIQTIAGAARVTETFAFVTTFSNGGTALGAFIAGGIVQAGHVTTALMVSAVVAGTAVVTVVGVELLRRS
jgi:hypothetical protein